MPADLGLRVADPGLGLVDRGLPLDRQQLVADLAEQHQADDDTTVPATTIVIAPMRTCSEERQACTARGRPAGEEQA